MEGPSCGLTAEVMKEEAGIGWDGREGKKHSKKTIQNQKNWCRVFCIINTTTALDSCTLIEAGISHSEFV